MSLNTTPVRRRSFSDNNQQPNILQANYNLIVQALTARLKIICDQQAVMDQQYHKTKTEIQYAKPSDIKIMHPNGLDIDHQTLKKIVQSAITSQSQTSFDTFSVDQNSPLDKERAIFQKQNLEMERQIQIKMKSIENIQGELKTNQIKLQNSIIDLERNQESLKTILRAKGSIEQAEKKQKQKKLKINQIRHIQQILSNFKDQKIVKIKEIIQCLQILNQYRIDRTNKIDHMYNYGEKYNVETLSKVLNNFMSNLEQLKQEKIKMMKQNSKFNSNNKNDEQDYRSNSFNKKGNENYMSRNSTPKNNRYPNTNPFDHNSEAKDIFNNRQFNQNKLQTKKIVLKASRISRGCLNQHSTLDDIVNEYEQILKSLRNLQETQLNYFRIKAQRNKKQFKIKAMEKSYLMGILGFDPSGQQTDITKYQKAVNYAIQKCHAYTEQLQEKSKERVKLSHKIRNIEESLDALKNQIINISTQNERKKNLLHQIQHIIKQSVQIDRKNQTKDIYAEYQKTKMKKILFEKQLQQYAELGDLEGYKKIKEEIENSDDLMKQLERKIKYETQFNNINKVHFGYQNKQLWDRIKQAIQKNNIDIEPEGITFKSSAQFLVKLSRRLQSI